MARYLMAAKVSRTIWVVLLVAGIAVLVFVAAARPGKNRPVPVTVTHAVRQNLSSWTTGNGKIEPIDPRVIQAQLATRIEKIVVTEGQTVKAGDVLLLLDATDAKSELAHMKEQLVAAQEDRKTASQGGSIDDLAQIDSDLAKTNSEISRLSRERDSLERLYSSQAATRLEIDQNRTALEKAQADKHLLEQKKTAIAERSKTQAERAGLRADEARESIR